MSEENSLRVDPQRVVVVTPTHDGNVCAGYAGGLVACAGLFAGVAFIRGHSNVALARNIQADAFLSQPQFDWLLSIDADIQFSRQDLEYLYEGDTQLRVAEYAKKELPPKQPARFGMGFALIHRSVFGVIGAHETGDEVIDSSGGLAALFEFEGRTVRDYFPTGVFNGRYLSEDRSFFGLCQSCNVSVRVETRTRLVHWGTYGFPYSPPETADISVPN